MQLKLPIKHAGGGHWIFRCQGIEKSHPEVRQVVLGAIGICTGPRQLKAELG